MAHNTWFYKVENGTASFEPTPAFTKGQFTFTPNETDQIKEYDFFHLEYFLLSADGTIANSLGPFDEMYNNMDGWPYSRVMTEALAWAKVMYSTVLADLGQSQLPNLLLDQTLLQWSLQYPDDKIRTGLNDYSCNYTIDHNCNYDWTNFGGIAAPGTNPTADDTKFISMNESYVAYNKETGPLGTKNAQIFSQYACSVPIRKDGGTLFPAILVADLVFLQALWTLLKWVADAMVLRRDQMAMACPRHTNDYGAIAMAPVGYTGMESQQKLVGGEASREVSIHDTESGIWNGYAPVR